MKRSEPSNETCLAAELATCPSIAPYRAAFIAHDLCRIGRAYKRMAEKLCGGEEEWGRWSDAVAKAQDRAAAAQDKRLRACLDLVKGLPVKVYVSTFSGLMLMAETKGVHRTVLL